MRISSKNKIDAGFSMASMTDLIFLLLVFFMLTSSFVTPSGLPVNLPSSKASTIEVQKISVTITKDLQYYVNDKKVSQAMLEGELKSRLLGNKGSVVLHIDKSVPSEHLVYVAGIATQLEAKVVVATKPSK
jgi:biopolymer transport protein ExbD